ncbi:hypothetical protein AB0A77_36255 [Streptomyces varsoviensis]|uniref:hypothetical protein n=1 Tax=Streptomyces varsoviensis TaxID=67373 RepID=UPI0033E095CE
MGYLTAHLTQDPPALNSVAAHIPLDWDELVRTLLRKEPDQRYATAAEVAEALRRLEIGLWQRSAQLQDDVEAPRLFDGLSQPQPAWSPTDRDQQAVGPVPVFELVRRGYDRDEVDAYLALPTEERDPLPTFSLSRRGYNRGQVDKHLDR